MSDITEAVKAWMAATDQVQQLQAQRAAIEAQLADANRAQTTARDAVDKLVLDGERLPEGKIAVPFEDSVIIFTKKGRDWTGVDIIPVDQTGDFVTIGASEAASVLSRTPATNG